MISEERPQFRNLAPSDFENLPSVETLSKLIDLLGVLRIENLQVDNAPGAEGTQPVVLSALVACASPLMKEFALRECTLRKDGGVKEKIQAIRPFLQCLETIQGFFGRHCQGAPGFDSVQHCQVQVVSGKLASIAAETIEAFVTGLADEVLQEVLPPLKNVAKADVLNAEQMVGRATSHDLVKLAKMHKLPAAKELNRRFHEAEEKISDFTELVSSLHMLAGKYVRDGLADEMSQKVSGEHPSMEAGRATMANLAVVQACYGMAQRKGKKVDPASLKKAVNVAVHKLGVTLAPCMSALVAKLAK